MSYGDPRALDRIDLQILRRLRAEGRLALSQLACELQLDRTTPDVFDRFKAAVLASDEVVECQMVAGGFDYLLKVRVRDMNARRRFLGERLAAIRGVMQTHTYFVMEQVKSTHAVCIADDGQSTA